MEKVPKNEGEQLEINFNEEEIKKEKRDIIELLSGTYPDYFHEENLIREGNNWYIMRLGKCLKIPDWIKETEEDIEYHSVDNKKDRYR